ncbi:alpha/beta fold hydrolase [Nocardiopsis sp. ATB16-24]|uniref:thioesterase domain-containing protein n=1 Tax=Nocardiopsis sp. ATB16-24 TaxID=3019555 RepID=UPI0025531361|nr:alpha/beta fold hydrolase [Nocardiopsis sp. ATB16-24]
MNHKSDNLVLLREGDEPAIALVHPASGLSTSFRRLLPHLAGRSAVYAYENLEPGPPELCAVEALAECYWGQLRREDPGPLVLAGWSFGGPVAVAMAALAEAEGHRILGVAAIDSGTPDLLGSREETLLGRLAGLFEVDPAVFPEELARRTETVEDALETIAAWLRGERGTDAVEADDLRPFVDAYLWHLEVVRRGWDAVRPRAPFLLVRGRDEKGWHDAPEDLGWSAALGSAPRIAWVPGTHYSVMSQENAPFVARLLSSLSVSGDDGGPNATGPWSAGALT